MVTRSSVGCMWRGTHLRAEDVDVRLGLLEAGAEDGLHERCLVPARASRAPALGQFFRRARQFRLTAPAERLFHGHAMPCSASDQQLLALFFHANLNFFSTAHAEVAALPQILP